MVAGGGMSTSTIYGSEVSTQGKDMCGTRDGGPGLEGLEKGGHMIREKKVL